MKRATHKSLRGLLGLSRARQIRLQQLGVHSAEQYAALMAYCPGLVAKVLGTGSEALATWEVSTLLRLRCSADALRATVANAVRYRRGLSESRSAGRGAGRSAIARELARTLARHGGLPAEVSLVGRIVRIHDQEATPYCVGHSGSAALEISAGKALSGPHLYRSCKRWGVHPNAEGSTNEALRKALETEGVCLLETWPSEEREGVPIEELEEPPDSANKEALQYRIKEDAGGELSTVDEIRAALAYKSLPVVLGMPVFESSVAAALRGEFPMRLGEEDGLLGYHDQVIVGYRDDAISPGGGRLLTQNSWGKSWAAESPDGPGIGSIPYAYFSEYGCEAHVFEPKLASATRQRIVGIVAGALALAACVALVLSFGFRGHESTLAFEVRRSVPTGGTPRHQDQLGLASLARGFGFERALNPTADGSTQELSQYINALNADILEYRARVVAKVPELAVSLAPVKTQPEPRE